MQAFIKTIIHTSKLLSSALLCMTGSISDIIGHRRTSSYSSLAKFSDFQLAIVCKHDISLQHCRLYTGLVTANKVY